MVRVEDKVFVFRVWLFVMKVDWTLAGTPADSAQTDLSNSPIFIVPYAAKCPPGALVSKTNK